MKKKTEKIALARINFLLANLFAKDAKSGKNVPDRSKLRPMAENIAAKAKETLK